MLTNEEKRVRIYTEAKRPTIPSKVNSKTPLEKINLNWSERDLPEKERTKHVHRLHPYLGKFIPQLVEIFLRKYFKPGQTVLDPFCGSGTALVQANELGINSIGYDISAFNILLCQVKTARYDLDRASKEAMDILQKTRLITKKDDRQLQLLDVELASFPETNNDNKYLKEWYAPQALKELSAYRSLIESEGYSYRNLLKIILSRSARSARLTTHFDLDFPKSPQVEPYWCYKHSRICKPTTEAYKFLRRYTIDTLRRIDEFTDLRIDAKTEVYNKDSRYANFSPIDGVITSPPYVGLIDYHEQHAYAYHLLNLKDRRDREIGPAVNGNSQKAKEEYQKDIAQVFKNITKALSKNGYIIVVAADKANLYPKIAELAGVKVENVIDRHVNRRTGRRSTEFYESIFIWRKQ